MTTFRDVIEQHYTARGIGITAALGLVWTQTGISMPALWNAYHGRRVTGTTAQVLERWALTNHRVHVDVVAMVTAPTRTRAAGKA